MKRLLTWLLPFIVRLYSHWGIFLSVNGGATSAPSATTEGSTAVSGGQPAAIPPTPAPSTLAEPKVTVAVSGGQASHLHQMSSVPGGHSSHVFAFAVLLLVSCLPAFGDPAPSGINPNYALPVAFASPQGGASGTTGKFDSNGYLYVNCPGCTGISPFVDNAAFTVGSSGITVIGGYYTSGAAPTLTSGHAGRLTLDSSSNLNINCEVGCAGGTFNNNSDGVATSATNGQSAAWLYGFNGTTWDRLRDDSNKYLYVDVGNASIAITAASLPLPSGASTAAKQPALGTAGSASADVITVQGIASMTALKVDGSGVTQPVSNAGTFAVQAAESGTWTNTVTQATGTNLHAVLDTTSTTAVTQATASNLNAAVVGTGTAGSAAGGVLTVQGVASMTKLLVTPDSVALPANQSVNVSQINAVTPLMGNGATGTGSQRVTVASDNTGIANWGQAATGGAVPSGAQYIGGNGSGNLTGFIRCDNSAVYDTNTNGKTQLVALSSGKVTYVCGLSITQSTSTTVSVSLGSGTGTNCGSTYTAKTPAWPIQLPASVGPGGLVLPLATAPWFQTAASEELCLSTSAGVSVQALVSYTQF